MSVNVNVQDGVLPGYVKVDPVIRYDGDDYGYEISKGSVSESILEVQAQGLAMDSIIFGIESMGSNLILNRRIIANWSVVFTINGTSPTPGQPLFVNGIDDVKGNVALRWMPMANSSETIDLTIAGVSSSYNPSNYLEPLDRYSGDDFFNNEMNSIGPSMHDTASNYNDSYQTLKDPLADYFNGQFNPRGSFEFELLTNTQTQATLRCKWSEPVIHPLLEFGRVSNAGFFALNSQTTIRYTGGDRGRRMLSIREDPVNLPTISSIRADFDGVPSVITRWLTPPTNVGNLTNKITRWPFANFINWQMQGKTVVPAGGSGRINTSTVSAQSVPSKLLVVLKESRNSFNWHSTDTYARIDNINITFGNKNGILAGSDITDLYVRACTNGLKGLSYTAWNKHVGTPLLLDFAKDIPMDSDMVVDMQGQFTLNIDVQFTNLSDRNMEFDLMFVPINTGVFTIKGTQGFLNTSMVAPGSVSEQDFANSIEGKVAFDNDDTFIEGGNVMDKARKVVKSKKFKNAMRGLEDGTYFGLNVVDGLSDLAPLPIDLKKITNVVRKYIPTAKDAVKTLAPLILGSGYDENMLYDFLVDSGYPEIEIRGSGITGGCGGGLTGGSLYCNRRSYERRYDELKARSMRR